MVVIGTRGYPSYYGGFETAVRHLAPALADAGWDVTVLGRHGQQRPDDPTADPRVRTVVTRGIDTRALSTLTHGFTAVLHVLRTRPRPAVALVMNCANGLWLPLLRLAGVRTVVNVDGIEWERAKWGPVARTVFRLGAALTARTADRLVYDAQAIADRWGERTDRPGVVIPYGGVPSADALHPDDAHLAGRAYALLVARFVPENTVAAFLAAAERIARHHPVVLVGGGTGGGALDMAADALAARNPDVHRLGHVSDDARLHALWRRAGVYFHGHSVGGTNPALVQAMHCGAPTVARDTVYNREVLGDDGALFVEPEPDHIADAVLRVLGDPGLQAALRDRATDRARTVYSWTGVCAAYERTLREVAAVS